MFERGDVCVDEGLLAAQRLDELSLLEDIGGVDAFGIAAEGGENTSVSSPSSPAQPASKSPVVAV